MKHVICPVCGCICIKHGMTSSGSQRWFCKTCRIAFTPKIDNSAKQLQIFLDWLFGKDSQNVLPGEGRTFRRNTSRFWDLWPLPPKVEEKRDVLYVDGIYLGRKACVLICCDDEYVLGWYLCRYEHSGAYTALLSRIAEPKVVVSDGGTGFKKAAKKDTWGDFRIECKGNVKPACKLPAELNVEVLLLVADGHHIPRFGIGQNRDVGVHVILRLDESRVGGKLHVEPDLIGISETHGFVGISCIAQSAVNGSFSAEYIEIVGVECGCVYDFWSVEVNAVERGVVVSHEGGVDGFLGHFCSRFWHN